MVEEETKSALEKCKSGIRGLDEITYGGLPKGRPTLVCGNAGCGKTILGMEFLIRGAVEFNEPGVFISFEETEKELIKNFASFDHPLQDLMAKNLLAIDFVYVERSEIEETGDYNLDGLFIRLGLAIDSIGAKRVVLDTIESLFAGLSNTGILRAELRRLFRWLKEKGVTTIVTGERGSDDMLTRHGLEEYVADCVILLDFRVTNQIATRRLRIVKYRGSVHGSDEYPFLIGKHGISIQPLTSIGLDYQVSSERIPSGVPRLDAMLEGQGYYRGSTILFSGPAGSGKTSLGASFVNAACQRGERCLYLSFEESYTQIERNMRSIGIDLEPWVKQGLLQFHTSRPSRFGLEQHLGVIQDLIHEFQPSVVVVDPISNLVNAGGKQETKSMLTRLIDYLKMNQITTVFTDLTHARNSLEGTNEEISSLIDTWILLRDIELNGERNRALYILKSRGMAHSNQIREFLMSEHGIELVDVYLGTEGVLTGSARAAQETRERNAALVRQNEVARRRRELESQRQKMEAEINILQSEMQTLTDEMQDLQKEEDRRAQLINTSQDKIGQLRKADH
jgi:circadian clock protein KaiC